MCRCFVRASSNSAGASSKNTSGPVHFFITNFEHCKCLLLIPQKRVRKKIITRFHREIIILMRKRRKLVKSQISDSEEKNMQILNVEQLICDSHNHERLHDEKMLYQN